MRMKPSFLLLTLVLGCAVNEPFVPLEEEPYIKRLSLSSPTEFVASFSRLSISFDATAINREAEGWFAIPPSEEWLLRLLIDSTERVRLFREIRGVVRDVEDAWKIGSDIVVLPKLKEYRVYYSGTNKLFVPNIIAWLFLLVPSWFIRDEAYGLRGEIEFSFISTHSGKELLSRTVTFETERSLNDFERGWQLLGIFRVPKSLSEHNWQKVERVLRQQVEKEIRLAVVRLMNEDVRSSLLSTSCREKMAKRSALVVGLSRYESEQLPQLKFAADDAIAFRKLLLQSTDQLPAERNIKILTNDAATKETVMKTLQSILKRLKPQDEFFFYFAGYGTKRIRIVKEERSPSANPTEAQRKQHSDKNKKNKDEVEDNTKRRPEYIKRRFAEPALFLFDSNPKEEDSLLPLLTLLSLFENCPARRVVVVLDTGFGTEKILRSVASSIKDAEPMKERITQSIQKSRIILITASDFSTSEGTAEFEHQKHGIFTFYLLQALTGKADVDKNGTITLKEAFSYIYPRVVEETQMEACAQHPLMLGKGAEDIILKRP